MAVNSMLWRVLLASPGRNGGAALTEILLLGKRVNNEMDPLFRPSSAASQVVVHAFCFGRRWGKETISSMPSVTRSRLHLF